MDRWMRGEGCDSVTLTESNGWEWSISLGDQREIRSSHHEIDACVNYPTALTQIDTIQIVSDSFPLQKTSMMGYHWFFHNMQIS
jgi:hypothetical protein